MYIEARREFTVKAGSKLHNKRHDMLSHTSMSIFNRGMKPVPYRVTRRQATRRFTASVKHGLRCLPKSRIAKHRAIGRIGMSDSLSG